MAYANIIFWTPETPILSSIRKICPDPARYSAYQTKELRVKPFFKQTMASGITNALHRVRKNNERPEIKKYSGSLSCCHCHVLNSSGPDQAGDKLASIAIASEEHRQ